jgi:biotin carboxylase
MNIVLFSPHFPSNFRHFVQAVQAVGARALVIADHAQQELHPELQAALSDCYKVRDLHDYDEIVRACGYFTYKYGKIDRFESHNEYWLEQDARVRTDFNIPGIKSAEIDFYKKKSRMKEKFHQAGVRYPRGKVVQSAEEALAWGEEVGYPVVVKPDNGVGASQTWRMDSAPALEVFFRQHLGKTCIMEEFIQGEISSFDGLVDRAGRLLFCTGHKYSQGIMETVNEDLHVSYVSYREIPQDLYAAGLKIVEHFAVQERFFHIEFFRTPGRDLVALEVNMRPPGGLTLDMFNYASNVDLYRSWAQMLVDEQMAPLPEDRLYHCAYISRKDRYTYQHSHEQILSRYSQELVQHEKIISLFGAALGDYGYIVRAAEEERIQEIINFIHAQV